jgi:hypothetical protein
MRKMTLSARVKRATNLRKAERAHPLTIAERRSLVSRRAAAFVAESEGLDGFVTTAKAVLHAGAEVTRLV